MDGMNVSRFLAQIGEDLIRDFDRAAGGSHPGEKGSVGESSARTNLARVLPQYMGVSTGFVLDSTDGRSLQTDVVIHEKSCPRFKLGHTDEFEYFPCEGVAAVGEVKTNLTKAELEDAYAKIATVKILKRQPGRQSFRKYGSTTAIVGEHSNALDPTNPYYQIMAFVLCKKLDFKTDTLLDHMRHLDRVANPIERPTNIVSLADGIFVRMKRDGESNQITHDVEDYTHIAHLDFSVDNFSFLVHQLTEHIVRGSTTAEAPIAPYLPQFREMPYKVAVER